MAKPESRLSRSPDASYQIVAGEAIVIHLKTGVYYSMNEVGTAFWNLLDGKRTIAECVLSIANQIVEDKPPLDVILADLLEISAALEKEQLVAEQ